MKRGGTPCRVGVILRLSDGLHQLAPANVTAGDCDLCACCPLLQHVPEWMKSSESGWHAFVPCSNDRRTQPRSPSGRQVPLFQKHMLWTVCLRCKPPDFSTCQGAARQYGWMPTNPMATVWLTSGRALRIWITAQQQCAGNSCVHAKCACNNTVHAETRCLRLLGL